jgi:hypothetical protein
MEKLIGVEARRIHIDKGYRGRNNLVRSAASRLPSIAR